MGFGTALVIGNNVVYESGEYNAVLQQETSNFHEAENLVNRVERGVSEKSIQGCELFMCTDNIVFEAGFYKGTSSSKKLFDLHLRLRVAMMKGDITAHMVHIAGTRMKGAGVDGLSRGDLLEGIIAHVDPLSFIPLNKSCDEREGNAIETWIRDW